MSFIDRVNKQREEAAKFYCVDFHVHSPASYDWDNTDKSGYTRNPKLDKISDTQRIDTETLDAYKERCKASGRQIVIITDHNKFGFAKEAASKSDKDITFIPGIELSVCITQPLLKDYRIHVLAIFPPVTGLGEIERLFPSGVPDEANRTGKEKFDYKNIDDLLSKIHKQNGIAIAAHIDSESGMRCVYRKAEKLILEPLSDTDEAKKQAISSLGDQIKAELYKFDYLQVKAGTDPIHFSDEEGEQEKPLVIGSDCHCAATLSTKDLESLAHVKMSSPDFTSLKEALKFPDTRVRFFNDLPTAHPPRILGLRIFSSIGGQRSFFKDTVLGFSDNLSCLIGPRGSGKSASIDAVRYLMGFNRSLGEIEKVRKQVEDRQMHTLEESSIEILYQRRDGTVHRIQATYDQNEVYNTKVYDMDGNILQIDDVEQSKDYPIKLYGWNELELLAEDPQTQRELLDRFIPDLKLIKEKKDLLLRELSTNRRGCLDQSQVLDEYFTNQDLDFRRLFEYQKEFNDLNTPEMEKVFEKLDLIAKKKSLIESAKEAFENTEENVTDSHLLEISTLGLDDEDTKDWAKRLFTDRLKATEFDDSLRGLAEDHKAKIQAATKILNAEELLLTTEQNEAEKEIQEAIGEDKTISGDLRNAAKRRYEKAKTNYENYAEEEGKLKTLLKQREELLTKLMSSRKEIFATRENEIKKIEKDVQLVEDVDFKIKLQIKQLGDRRAFQELLTTGISRPTYQGQWKHREIPKLISSKLTPEKLAKVILENKPEEMVTDSKKSGTGIDKAYAEKFVEENIPISEIENFDVNQYDASKLAKVLDLQEAEIDDEFFIELGGQPIQFCSPGQRCSAMLPIVTLTSDAPLIIDQPEDNLDNRLVSRAFFKILSKLKETRQIILSTHNPNILVSGDAEQVLILNSSGELEEYGCIDKAEIVKTVISLMEGGETAFEKRQRKYKPFIKD